MNLKLEIYRVTELLQHNIICNKLHSSKIDCKTSKNSHIEICLSVCRRTIGLLRDTTQSDIWNIAHDTIYKTSLTFLYNAIRYTVSQFRAILKNSLFRVLQYLGDTANLHTSDNTKEKNKTRNKAVRTAKQVKRKYLTFKNKSTRL